jgi:hypothetical protein
MWRLGGNRWAPGHLVLDSRDKAPNCPACAAHHGQSSAWRVATCAFHQLILNYALPQNAPGSLSTLRYAVFRRPASMGLDSASVPVLRLDLAQWCPQPARVKMPDITEQSSSSRRMALSAWKSGRWRCGIEDSEANSMMKACATGQRPSK